MDRIYGSYDTASVAILLGLSRKTVLAYLASGRLTGHKIGTGQRGIWLVPTTEVERYKRERKGPGRPVK